MNITAVRQCKITVAFRLRHPCVRMAPPVCCDSADWLRNFGLSLSPRKHVNSQRGFPKGVSMWRASASSSEENPHCSTLWSVTQLSRPGLFRWGEAIHARVRMRDASWRDIAMTDLKEYVTEELNPENKKAVDGAEVFVPSPLLSSGMCFVDTDRK